MIQFEPLTVHYLIDNVINNVVPDMLFQNWLTYFLVYPFSWEWGWGNPLLAIAFLSVFKQLDLILAYVVYGIWNKFLLPTPSIEGRCYMSLNMPLRNLFGSLLRLQ